MLTVDLTDLPQAQIGSEVTLWGRASHDAVLPIDEPRGVYQIAILDPNQPRAGVLVSTPWRTAAISTLVVERNGR